MCGIFFEKHKDVLDVNMVKSFVSILYKHIVVGEVVNLIDDIYGGRTSLFLTSQRMPAATDAYTYVYNCKNITIL